MRKWFVLIAILILSLSLIGGPIQASGPSDEPPGLQQAIAAKERHANELLAVTGVAGAAVGVNGNGRAAVIVFTETGNVRGIPGVLDGVPVVVQVSGKFTALPRPVGSTIAPSDRWPRPVPIGVSTGHPAITAGTIGARVRDTSGNVYALSNNHIYANENRANMGDAVIQPGTYDGGVSPADNIGTLSAFEPIVFSTAAGNTIDAAIALSATSMLGKSTPPGGYGTPKSTTATATINMKVKKFGRTTGLTKGQVYAIHATVNVTYDSGVARFVEQIVVTPGKFSRGGDSGSLIVTDSRTSASDRLPVGLLFAGSQTFTVASPIDPVLARFGVTIDGE
ncbi:MAG: hypothetical protein HYX87_03505 [Chloroflexi bacterium]|nr:hypothetical protein [Chloroflexota bacterium]